MPPLIEIWREHEWLVYEWWSGLFETDDEYWVYADGQLCIIAFSDPTLQLRHWL